MQARVLLDQHARSEDFQLKRSCVACPKASLGVDRYVTQHWVKIQAGYDLWRQDCRDRCMHTWIKTCRVVDTISWLS